VGRGQGIKEEQLTDLADYTSSSAFDARTRAALDLATAMSQTPPTVDSACFANARKHFDEAELVELCAAIAWENYRSRFNRAFDLPADDFTEGSFCVLPVRAQPNQLSPLG